jgi:hypothetical protein
MVSVSTEVQRLALRLARHLGRFEKRPRLQVVQVDLVDAFRHDDGLGAIGCEVQVVRRVDCNLAAGFAGHGVDLHEVVPA